MPDEFTWTQDFSDWPDWKDAGRHVEIERTDGTKASGKLVVSDFFPIDSGDEVPVFMIQGRDGVEHSFADAVRWRYLQADSTASSSAE